MQKSRLIGPNEDSTTFTALTYIKAGHLYKKLFKKAMKKLIIEHNRHVAEEGETLKRLLDN